MYGQLIFYRESKVIQWSKEKIIFWTNHAGTTAIYRQEKGKIQMKFDSYLTGHKQIISKRDMHLNIKVKTIKPIGQIIEENVYDFETERFF